MTFPYPAAVITGILAMIVSSGGEYGEYLVIKKSDRTAARADKVYMQEVIDGDTFTLDTGETVRLAEVNAPETGACFADEAHEALTKVLTGKPLRLVLDETRKDSFGRLLRIVMVPKADASDGYITVQEYLAVRGLVTFTPHGNRAYQSGISAGVAYARSHDIGMWKACKKEMDALRVSEAWWVDEDVAPSDPSCIIKGNISASGHGKQYFLPTCKNYSTIKISPKLGEQYFCTERGLNVQGFAGALIVGGGRECVYPCATIDTHGKELALD